MSRITEADLRAVVRRINQATGSPMDAYNPQGVEPRMAPGNYHLDYAYGGVALYRVCSPTMHGQGVENVFSVGHTSKRELYDRMHAFLAGVSATKAMQPAPTISGMAIAAADEAGA